MRLIQHWRKCWYFFKYFTSRSFENCLFFKDKILFSLFPEKTTNPFTFTTRTYTVAIRIKRASNRLPFSPKLHFQVLPFYQIPVTTRLSPSFHPPPCPGYFLITSIRTISMRRSPDTRRTRAEEREIQPTDNLIILPLFVSSAESFSRGLKKVEPGRFSDIRPPRQSMQKPRSSMRKSRWGKKTWMEDRFYHVNCV